MKQVVVFYANGGTNVYGSVQKQANDWLQEHPNITIIASHTNASADADMTEFSLTLIVELPEEGQTHG